MVDKWIVFVRLLEWMLEMKFDIYNLIKFANRGLIVRLWVPYNRT